MVTPMLKPKHQKFVEAIASGSSGSNAYKAAYPGTSDRVARVNASRLLARADVKEELSKLQKDLRAETVLSLIGKREFLCAVVLSKDGRVKMSDKLRAIELDAKLAGELREQVTHEAGDSLLSFLTKIRRGGRSGDKNAIAGNVEP